METSRKFSQSEVNRIFPMPSRTLQSWIKAGLVRWSGEHRDSRGIHREYTWPDLVRLGVVEELADLGFPSELVRIFVSHLKEDQPDDPSWLKLPYSLIISKYPIKKGEMIKILSEGSGPLFPEVEARVKKVLPEEQPFIGHVPTEGSAKHVEALKRECTIIVINLGAVAEKVRKYIEAAKV